jgi:hypothetical protein
MDPRSRAALIKRVAAVLGPDRPAPRNLGDLNMTERLQLQEQDPEAVLILRGDGAMPPALEIAVISGTLADTAPVGVSETQQRQKAIAEWCDAHPVLTSEEKANRLDRQIAERLAADEQSRQESTLLAQRMLASQAAAGRGW